MKKKILAIIAIMAICCTALFAGCDFWDDAVTLTFTNLPSDTFYQQSTDEALSQLHFTLVASSAESGDQTFTYDGTKGLDGGITGLRVSGFDTTRLGKMTATIVFQNAQLRFDYQVVPFESRFAGGNGSELAPYKIATEEQFQNMLDNGLTETAYYKFANDITLTKPVYQPAHTDAYKTSGKAWDGYIDGNGFTLKNLNKVYNHDKQGISKYNELFGAVGSFTMKDLSIEFAASGDYATTGLITTGCSEGNIRFENVDVSGTIDASKSGNSSLGVYVNYIGRLAAHKVDFVNCDNSVKIYNTSNQVLVGGYACSQSSYKPQASFTNCKSSAVIEGAQWAAGGFFAANTKDVCTLTFNGCEFNGTIVKLNNNIAGSAQIFAYGGAKYNANDTLIEYNTTEAKANGTISTNLFAIDVALGAGTGALTITADEENIDAIAYYKVTYSATSTYRESGSASGRLVFGEDCTKTGLDTTYQCKKVRFVNDGETGLVAGEYYNPGIKAVLGEGETVSEFVLTDTALLSGIVNNGQYSVLVFACNSEGKVIGYSASVSVVDKDGNFVA